MGTFATHHVNLGEGRQLVLSHRVLDKLFGRVGIRAWFLPRDRECAELALHAANVRLVQVQVLDEVHLVAAAAHTAGKIGELTDCECVVGLHQGQSVLEVQPLTGFDLLANRGKRVGAFEDRHQCSRLTTAWVRDASSSR